MSAPDKDRGPGTFMIQACRCRRCGGLLTSKEGVRNGIGHVCRMKTLREMPDPNQVTVFDVLNDKEENTHAKLTEQAAIPVIIVTANQDDYPRRYVARLWDMSVPASTQYMVLEDTLEDLRKAIPAEMSRLPAAPDDSIVEAWL